MERPSWNGPSALLAAPNGYDFDSYRVPAVNLEQRAQAAFDYYDRVHREVFAGDPAANPRLKVEVLAPARVADVDTLVLVTPWTLNGMFFADEYPDALDVGARSCPVFVNDLPDLGRYGSVNLVSDVSAYESPERARSVASSLVKSFQEAIAAWRAANDVADPSRRSLLRGKLDRPDG